MKARLVIKPIIGGVPVENITLGNIYSVIDVYEFNQSTEFYTVIDDDGNKKSFNSNCFNAVAEYCTNNS